MRTFKKTICIEEFISRIPGLFPYLEFDEFGISVKHKATDSIDGCYGKIIPDLTIDGEKIPYRSLMRDYYEGELDDGKLETITKGIGRIDIKNFNVDGENYSFTDSQTLVPEFIYAAEAKSMLSELYNLKKSCEIYNRGGLLASKSLCCDCDKFKKMGGDTMIVFLEKIAIPKAEQWAEELFREFSDDDAQYYVNISLTGNYEDIGYLTPYPYKNVCDSDSNTETPISTEKRKYIIAISKNEYDDLDETEKPKYGKYHFLKGFNGSSILVGDNESYVNDDAYQGLNDDGKAKYNDYITYVKISDDNIDEEGYTDSKLKSLRCYTTYMNDDNVYEQPDEGEDWLFFYSKGYVANYEAIKDENGNISTLDEGVIEEDGGGYVTNLAVYGNIITNIRRDKTDRSITFEYYINAHLKAKKKEDVDGTTYFYFYFPFEYCDGGVKQTETYYYAEDGDIDGMSDDEFSQYTDISNENYIDRRFENRKCAFSTLNSMSETEKRIYDKNVSITNIQSKFEYTRENTVEVYNADVFKEDYLMGVHFKPMVENNVNIKRGNNSAFERHIRLGEVKTLEDMENYMNGSFFNIQQLV